MKPSKYSEEESMKIIWDLLVNIWHGQQEDDEDWDTEFEDD